jgi:hypothetical protein
MRPVHEATPAHPAAPGGPAKKGSGDDLPLGLPPLDGELGDAEQGEPDAERLDDDEIPKDDGGDPFDDATGEGDVAPDLLESGASGEDDAASLLDGGEADGLDIGAPDLVRALGDDDSARLTDEGRDDDRPHEDYGLGEERAASALDAGEEGPETDDESLSDDGLPPLDQDDDGALDAAESFFDGDLSEAHASRRPGWSTLWERFGQELSLPPSRGLARVRGGVLSAGRELVRVDLEGAVERLAARGLRGGETTRVLVAGEDIYVTTERGGLFASRDRGASFAAVSGWREHVRPDEAAAGLDVVSSVDGSLWGRTAQGSLLSCSGDGGERWEKADVDGFVHAVGTDEAGNVVALVSGLGAIEVLRRALPRGAWSRTAIPADLLASPVTGAVTLAAHGASVAVAVEGEGVVRSIGGGAWSRLAGVSAPTAMVMLDASGVVVLGDGRAGARLVCVGADGESRAVAVWDAGEGADGGDGADEHAEADAGVTGIAVDDAHEVVWVGGAFGVAAFQPKMR